LVGSAISDLRINFGGFVMCLRKIFLFAMVLVMLFAFIIPVYAGDTYEQTVRRRVFSTGVLFYGTVDMTADSVGSWYTNSMFIGNCNTNNAMIWAICSNVTGTEDVNVFAQYSQEYDGTWVLADSASGKIIDALGTTTKRDTINVIDGVNDSTYPAARWLSLKFIGQTSNPLTTVSWYVFLKFDSSITSDWKNYWNDSSIAPVMVRTD